MTEQCCLELVREVRPLAVYMKDVEQKKQRLFGEYSKDLREKLRKGPHGECGQP